MTLSTKLQNKEINKAQRNYIRKWLARGDDEWGGGGRGLSPVPSLRGKGGGVTVVSYDSLLYIYIHIYVCLYIIYRQNDSQTVSINKELKF